MDYIIDIILTVIISVAIFAAIAFGFIKLNDYQEQKENDLWNNGYCSECDGQWIYEQAVGHRYSTSYIYVCDKCGKRIEIGEIR